MHPCVCTHLYLHLHMLAHTNTCLCTRPEKISPQAHTRRRDDHTHSFASTCLHTWEVHYEAYVGSYLCVICTPVCHNGASVQILAGPSYTLSLARFFRFISLTIWSEHQLNCCCFSAAWPVYRSNTHARSRTNTDTHTHAYFGWRVYRSERSHMALLMDWIFLIHCM